MKNNKDFLSTLKHKWTATVQLNNGQEITMWYTSYPMRERSIKKIISVSSDYLKSEIVEVS